MTANGAAAAALLTRDDHATPLRISESALADGSRLTDLAGLRRWLTEYGREAYTHVSRLPLDDLTGWHTYPETGNIGHHSGKSVSRDVIVAAAPGAAATQSSQPIIEPPEVGILGILVKEFDGVLHLFMQAKVKPGNANWLQHSPSIQV